MIKGVNSPRKMASKGAASPRVTSGPSGKSGMKKSPSATPRTPRKLETRSKPSEHKKTMKQITERVEVMELPSRLVPGSINVKTTSSGDRIRGVGCGDSCMRLTLECLSKDDIKEEMKESTLPYHQLGYQDVDDNLREEEEQEEYDEEKMTTVLAPDRARFNIWKGTNYDLHLLGDFKSDFERRVKSFQRPETQPISMDPFCRSESGLSDEPCRGEAFVVWKSNKSDHWKQIPSNTSLQDIIPSTLTSSEEEDDIDQGVDGGSDEDSLPDPEMTEYIRTQKGKLKEGQSLSGETLYYDEEFGVVRNLHRESHSITNYGVMPDETWIGKANIFYPEMSAAEKKMLQAVVSHEETTTKNKRLSPKPTV